MRQIAEIEAIRLADSVRTTELARQQLAAGHEVKAWHVVLQVVASMYVCGLGAARLGEWAQPTIAALAGGALTLAVYSCKEARLQRRRVDALLALYRARGE